MDKKKKNYHKDGVAWSGGRPPKAVAKDLKEGELRREGSVRSKALLAREEGDVVIKRTRLDAFIEEYLKNGGNATQAALDTGEIKSRYVASKIGYQLLKKAKLLGRIYMEEKGYGYGKMLDVALSKMMMSKNPEWWDRLMKLANYDNFIDVDKSTGPQVVNIVQASKDFLKDYVDAEFVEDVTEDDENENKEKDSI